jgi:hypothetical protein
MKTAVFSQGVKILAVFAMMASIEANAVARTIDPEKLIMLTVHSHQLVLIDVSEVKIESKTEEHGIEWTTKFIKADVAEVIRGGYDGKLFTYRSTGYEMTDKVQAKAHSTEDQFEIFKDQPYHQAWQCKVGHRYLVMVTLGEEWFYEVPKDDNGWRAKIIELEDGAPGPREKPLGPVAEEPVVAP